jgi:hypothetical protein
LKVTEPAHTGKGLFQGGDVCPRGVEFCMKTGIPTTTDQMELALYNLAGRYHGFYEEVAHASGFKANALRQAMNPNYAERPSFIARTSRLLKLWIRLHPASGARALAVFVADVLADARAGGDVPAQLREVERGVAAVRRRIEEVRDAIDAIPSVMLEPREVVRVRKARTTEGPKRRSTPRLKQPAIL